MYKNWPSGKVKKDKSQKDVEKIINIISELRSFKNELNVSPGSFVDLSMNKIAKKNRSLMDNNEIILKKLGRINNFFEKDQDRPSATLVISGDIFITIDNETKNFTEIIGACERIKKTPIPYSYNIFIKKFIFISENIDHLRKNKGNG